MALEAQNKDNLIAGAASITIHGILLLILIFSLLRTPIPPLGGGSGVVLNLGYVDEGTGEVQTMNEANNSPITEEAKPQEIPTPTETPVEEQEPEEPQTENEDFLTSEEETGVTAKESEEEAREKAEKKEKKPRVEEKKAVTPEKVEQKAVYTGKSGTANAGGNNNGDKEGKVGDQGNPEGELNAKALYGNPGSGGDGKGGSGGGASLDMSGWKMDFKIKTDDSDENGRLRFKIVVDEEGEVIKIETLEKSVSTQVENYYKRQIENGSFIKDKNTRAAQNSTGFLTIIIRSK